MTTDVKELERERERKEEGRVGQTASDDNQKIMGKKKK